MIQRIIFYFLIFFFILISPSWTYEFESCCSNEKTLDNSTRLLLCPINFLIQLRSAIFYTGNGCARSTCQKRLNKYYLSCNNHRTCSISIQCILMDSSTCSWLTNTNIYSQYLTIDYDCILHKSETPLIPIGNQSKKEQNENIVLFSAKVNIETPPDSSETDSISSNDENKWQEYFLKKYFHSKKINDDKTIIVHQPRSLINDIFRTIIILIIFTFILILFMIIALLLYKHITLMKKRKLYGQDKHRPFPTDDAYDNLKATRIESASETGTTTDV
ncbi:unnamed protein product [Rotaria magnacalcarata]